MIRRVLLVTSVAGISLGAVTCGVTEEQRARAVDDDAVPFDLLDPEAPPLRYASWRPMYDPNTFLTLVIASDGFLSRYSNADADDLIARAGAEPDVDARNALYQELGRLLQDDPAAIYLWNAVTRYGIHDRLAGWQPRGDDYILLTEGQMA